MEILHMAGGLPSKADQAAPRPAFYAVQVAFEDDQNSTGSKAEVQAARLYRRAKAARAPPNTDE